MTTNPKPSRGRRAIEGVKRDDIGAELGAQYEAVLVVDCDGDGSTKFPGERY